jgi:type VI secretion system FHA domain protein
VAESDLAAMLAAAGLHDVQVTPELADNFGQILRVVVTGVMDILQARQQTKDEFGMPVTVFKRADNNPLKFSANVEDALHNLLVKRNPAYLGPVDAFQDAFDDLRSHQMAVLAGVREAFTAMLTQFDPDTLEKQFDRQVNRGALVKVPAKLRYWELYRQWIHDMVGGDPEATYSRLFGEEFARAYEAQLKELKAHGRAKKP